MVGETPGFDLAGFGEGSFIGIGARFVDGVTLGDGCFVTAGAVVCHGFPARSRLSGVPARLVKNAG